MITNEFITAVLTAEPTLPFQAGHGPVEYWTVVGGISFSPADLAAIKWQYDRPTMSHFEDRLWSTIERADAENLSRLEAGFPAEVMGYRNWVKGDLAKRLQMAAEHYHEAR